MLKQTTIKIWDVNIDNIVISKLVKIKSNLKYLIGYLGRGRDRINVLSKLWIFCISSVFFLSLLF